MAELLIDFTTVSPSSGTGDSDVQLSASAYTGRVQRSVAMKARLVDNPTKLKTFRTRQEPKPEFVTINNASVAKEGGTLTVTGTSNSSKLTFTLDADAENPLNLVFPATYLAGTAATANGEAIADDPGASAEYQFTITFPNIPENTDIDPILNTITVADAGGHTQSATLTQAAGDPYINIDQTEIVLDVNGTAKILKVYSNTKWEIVEDVQE